MAISPHQLEEAFMEEVNGFEKQIDSMLSRQKITKGGSITTSVPHGMSSLHFNIIRSRYTNAGWSDVQQHDDQREGSWLSFKY